MTPASDAVRALLAAEGLDPEHPPDVLAEAEALAAAPGLDDPDLVDLTGLPFVTIDEVHSQDLDQAVHVAPEGDGHVVWYALADAAYYVRAGTALFAEALRRGSSFYLPGLVVPMLPRVLSEGVVSLLPGVDRRALVFRMALDADGRCTETRILRARIHSRQKLAFGHVQAFLDGDAEHPVTDPDVGASLKALAVVGRRRMSLADERNVVRYRRREVDVALGPDGLRFVCMEDLRRDVERFNEQVSVLANVEGARFLAGGGDHVQPIFRVHEPPAPERVAKLVEQLDGLARTRHLGASWRWNPDHEPLAAYLDRLPGRGPDARVAAAIHRQAVMSSGEASFTDTPGAHHGLGADVYARFTAPMREIVGVFLHEEAIEKLTGAPMPVPPGTPSDEVLREQVIASANRSRELQKRLDRETNRLVLDQLFAEVGREARALRGTVMGITRAKLHVRLDAPPIDVKVYTAHLEQRHGALFVQPDGAALRTKDGGHALVKLGDAVDLRVLGRDERRDRWELAVERAD